MHIPVLKKEVLRYLNPKPNENFIDCTIGSAGHTIEILNKIRPNGKVLGIELDGELYRKLKEKNLDRLILVNDSYINLEKIVEKHKFRPVDGILLDLGMSSWQLEKSGRGFSFLKNEPLDMRYSESLNDLTAEKIINKYSQEEIEKILREYGEEGFAERIAEKIVEARRIKPIETTFQLNEIVKNAIPIRYQHGKIHYSTRTFQALRIVVNDELNNLRKVLPQIIEILSSGGRIVIISFHSLEDRIVKNFFRNLNNKKLKILTKKPITPNKEEINFNRRSRSAKLRAAKKI